MNKLSKTLVATIVFALIEMVVLRLVVAAAVKSSGLGMVFANDLTYNVFVFGIAGVLAYLIGWLLFQKWNAKFSVKLAAAVAIVAGSAVLSYWVSTVIYRLMLPY